MKQGPPVKTPEQGPKVLSFKEFIKCNDEYGVMPRYNNFILYFADGTKGIAAPIYKAEPHYKKFALEYPEMNESLCERVTSREGEEAMRPIEKDLYEAYKIMRGYGVSDEDLFA